VWLNFSRQISEKSQITEAASGNVMSEDGDHGDMEDAGHSSADFFDHDPCKREKIEVR
jgi:hypothetical protein